MGVPLIQKYYVGRYVMKQKLLRKERYPLVLMLEPLFRCNLACAGCGKINYPEEILSQRLSADQCLAAIDECHAPIVSIAGGEPLLHREMPLIVEGAIKRKKFVYLCSNGLLVKTHITDYRPSKYFTISIHLDGNRERHDRLASQEGVYDQAIEAIKQAKSQGFRVTINCTLYEGFTAQEASEHFDFVMSLGVEGITVSPGYSYIRAPGKSLFLKRTSSKQLFRDIFQIGKKRKWKFNQSSLFLDFLAGNQNYQCTPWGNPTRNIFGWQKPCYLLTDEGYAPNFKALMEETDWSNYGPNHNHKCANCMLHSGFEPTAVNDTLAHPLKAFKVFLHGPLIDGPMVREPTGMNQEMSNDLDIEMKAEG